MTAKIATAAMALMANGLCLLWSSGTAPTIATRPARCVMAIRHSACTASAPCACAIPDGTRTVFVLEADLPLAEPPIRAPSAERVRNRTALPARPIPLILTRPASPEARTDRSEGNSATQ